MRDVTGDFPILTVTPYGHRLVYLDSAASAQRPRSVIDRMSRYYQEEHANIHRSAHYLAEKATGAYEAARRNLASFVGAYDWRGVVFTRNVTEALNLVARTVPITRGDKIVLTKMEHHSNIVPWQLRAEHEGAVIDWIDVDPSTGLLVLDDLDKKLDGARIVSFTHVSNVLGTINPVGEITRRAHEAGALVCIDGAQAAPHMPVDVSSIDADFYGITGHKMMGPTGIGVLVAKPEILEELPPFLGGGEMIEDVRLDRSTWAELPWKFEAGTPMIAEAMGLSCAVEYLCDLGMDEVRTHEIELVQHTLQALKSEFGDLITLYGPSDPQVRGAAVSFTFADVHPHDLATILDQRGVAIRAGHHCAKPLMRVLDVAAVARASFYVYNGKDDVDILIEALHDAARIFEVA